MIKWDVRFNEVDLYLLLHHKVTKKLLLFTQTSYSQHELDAFYLLNSNGSAALKHHQLFMFFWSTQKTTKHFKASKYQCYFGIFEVSKSLFTLSTVCFSP